MNNNFRGNNRGRRPWNRQKRGGRGSWARGGGRQTNNYGRNFSGDRSGNNQFGSNRQYKRDTPSKRLTEEEIGVTEYISDHKGFSGIIKSRFSDFQVSEINEEGEVAKLTDVKPPELPKDEAVDEDEDLLFNKYNLEILPMETWDKINQLVQDTNTKEEKVEIDVTGMAKDQRTKIHEAVKKAFGESVVGSTVTVDDKKFVQFDKYRKGIRIDNRVKWVWPEEYLYFVLYKENCDTMEAVSRLAERLRMNIKPSMIGYAGTKDRRAKTSQWVSVRRADPRRVAAACTALRPLRVGNYRFRAVPLKLGMLKGNRFRICLRNVTAPDSTVDEACALLRDNGFINYYGLQRFGSRADVPTYLIGQKLLQGKFKEAIDLILHSRSGPLSETLQLYHSGDIDAALGALSASVARAHPVESRLLQALAERPNDLLGALAQISRNNRLLYLHAYQSLLWNRAASRRLRRARGVLPGDLVPDTAAGNVAFEALEEDSENDDEEIENNDTEDKEKQEKTEGKSEKENKKNKREPKELIKVKVLTQEDVDSGSYSLSDVVLPLPGYKVTYPPNMKDFYEDELQKDGLKLDMVHKFKSYSLSGGYRTVVTRAGDLSWRTVNYRRPHGDLLLSDADELDGAATAEDPDGPYKALLMTMDLPSSCYATMALRELLRIDTSSESQAQLNNYHVKDKQTDGKTEMDGQTEAGQTENGGEKRKNDSDDNVDNKKVKAN
ncbi:pseudouridylate synthase 7 homolog [Aricia agestis]|uniref:pseudouridylate synthase 7 homolog n=1 Tax=Aricia agestis TaxID=91739 RepID=UPI001C2039DB|nr:pseudouridylate synthase 7 homolog [Aricia agestis]